MSELQLKLNSDAWVVACWDEYIQVIESPACEKAKGYYYDGKMRVEMPPVGNDHASDHTIVLFAVTLFASIKGINLNGKDCCSYRQVGVREVQPDISYYVGDNADVVPYGTSIINLDVYPPPDLVIEVANTSLADDQGAKRLLYEDLGVKEYWIVDVLNVQVIAFLMENGGSRRISESLVLPGLAFSLLNEALRRTRQMNHGQVGSWLLTQFQNS
jgi:Uma2 family endonuclease